MDLNKEKILKYLNKIEKEQNIKIIYACEVGSRIWQYSTPTSDFDIRIIFCREKKDYLRLDPLETSINIIDEEANIDITGFDIRRFIEMIYKENLTTCEWLMSPIIYVNLVGNEFTKILTTVTSFKKFFFTNLNGIVKTNLNKSIRKKDKVSIKAYLHTVKALFINIYFLKNPDEIIYPVVLFELIENIKDELPAEIIEITMDLIERRKHGEETIDKNDELTKWIEQEVCEQGKTSKKLGIKKEDKSYDSFNILIDKIIV